MKYEIKKKLKIIKIVKSVFVSINMFCVLYASYAYYCPFSSLSVNQSIGADNCFQS